uniref:Uncharacterized protein n=1 Tax=Romanomermis culicivorax TaxID=13658 RepID=A0A915I5R1_ROMCU
MVGLKFYAFALTALMVIEIPCFGLRRVKRTTWQTYPRFMLARPDDLRPIFAQECGLMCKFQKMLKSMEYFVCTFARTQARARKRLLLQRLALQQLQDSTNYGYDGLESEPKKNLPLDQEQAKEKEGDEHKGTTTQ